MSDTTPDAPALVRIRCVSPCRALEVPLLRGRIVKRGEVLEVSPEHAERLTRQSIWELVDGDPSPPAKSAPKADWATYADAIGIDTTDLTRDQIVAAVQAALEN